MLALALAVAPALVEVMLLLQLLHVQSQMLHECKLEPFAPPPCCLHLQILNHGRDSVSASLKYRFKA